MSNETDLDAILKHGYEQFLNGSDDLDDCDNAIITVRRQQQITTHFGPLKSQKKIKVSLSQEQILNQPNIFRSNIQRSQSINIQKSLLSPNGMKNELRRRPSLIPVKIEKQQNSRAITLEPNHNPNGKSSLRMQKLTRNAPGKHGESFDRHYATQQETILSSLPIPVTQSMYPSLNLEKSDLDRFKCGICLNVLSDSRVLDCLHTFCFECLFTIDTNQSKSKLAMRSASTENKSNDTSNRSDDLKEDNKNVSKTSMAVRSTTKSSLVMPKKKPDQKKLLGPRRPLSSITEKNKISLKCPICGFRTEIPIGGINRVPKNYLLERQLHDVMVKMSVPLSNKLCSQCYEEIEAVAYCLNCEINLCDICKEAHRRQRWTSTHNLTAISDWKSNKIDQKEENTKLVPTMPLKCFIHATQELKWFCVNCDQIACHNCTILLHKGHKFESIDRAKQHSINALRASVERNQMHHESIVDSVSKLAVKISKLNVKADVVQNEIEVFFKNYFEALEAHKGTLLRKMAKIKESQAISVMEQQNLLKRRAHDAKQANSFAENLLINGNDIEILTFVGLLQGRFNFCQQSKTPMDCNILKTFKFLREVRAPMTSHQNIPIYGILEEANQK